MFYDLDQIYDELAAIWKPIGDAIDKVTSAVTGGLSDSINNTLALVSGITTTAMLDLITYKLDD